MTRGEISDTLLQAEIILTDDEYTTHRKEVGAIADTLGRLTSDTAVVVTDATYKRNLTSGELEDTALQFQQRVWRALPDDTRREKMAAAQATYAAQLGLGRDDEISGADAVVSDYTLTVTTRRGLVDALGALDTESTRARINRSREHGRWLMYIVDATDGLFVTKKKTEALVDLLVEGEAEDSIDTVIDPEPADSPDMPVFSGPGALARFLEYRGLIESQEEDAPTERIATLPGAVVDMHDVIQALHDMELPNSRDLYEFHSWIFTEGTEQEANNEYLKAIFAQMEQALGAATEAEREAIVNDIRLSLAEAYSLGLGIQVVRECAQVINTLVMTAPLKAGLDRL
jgi:hypothetical protein